MLLACFLPLLPWVTSKDTFCPSFSVLNPGMLIWEKCAKRSSPPPSGVMKPKPLESLNHLTVPVAMLHSYTDWRYQARAPVTQGNQGREVTTEEPLYGHYVAAISLLDIPASCLIQATFSSCN